MYLWYICCGAFVSFYELPRERETSQDGEQTFRTFHVRTSLNLNGRSLALCEEMDIWQVIVFCIHADEPLNYVYVRACGLFFFGTGQRTLSICHVLPAWRLSHSGEDRWTEFSFSIL